MLTCCLARRACWQLAGDCLPILQQAVFVLFVCLPYIARRSRYSRPPSCNGCMSHKMWAVCTATPQHRPHTQTMPPGNSQHWVLPHQTIVTMCQPIRPMLPPSLARAAQYPNRQQVCTCMRNTAARHQHPQPSSDPRPCPHPTVRQHALTTLCMYTKPVSTPTCQPRAKPWAAGVSLLCHQAPGGLSTKHHDVT